MKKVLFAAATAVMLNIPVASADVILGTTDSDQKLWINTSSVLLLGTAYPAVIVVQPVRLASPAFLLDENENDQKLVINQYGMRR